MYVATGGGFPTTPTTTLTDPANTAADFFGNSVATAGNTIVIGAYGTNGGPNGKGAAYAYTAPSAGGGGGNSGGGIVARPHHSRCASAASNDPGPC
ncbi:MAG TPA: FG-GAP repeat protein [Sporichthyaceae bacterium]|nr:FG-GAP repeat protein [Sporichthyaceae bacterium]